VLIFGPGYATERSLVLMRGEIVMTPAVFYLVWSKLLKKVRFLTMGPSSVAAY
jgi:hypothetical protein